MLLALTKCSNARPAFFAVLRMRHANFVTVSHSQGRGKFPITLILTTHQFTNFLILLFPASYWDVNLFTFFQIAMHWHLDIIAIMLYILTPVGGKSSITHDPANIKLLTHAIKKWRMCSRWPLTKNLSVMFASISTKSASLFVLRNNWLIAKTICN